MKITDVTVTMFKWNFDEWKTDWEKELKQLKSKADANNINFTLKNKLTIKLFFMIRETKSHT